MPLVYQIALKRRNTIAKDMLLEQLEIHGFAKCVSRKSCLDNLPHSAQINALTESLVKQLDDYEKAIDREDKLEALADIRNVAGLLFLALKS
ncbi:hypothetical protein MUP46_02385 [Patescibacteria group bacterium]|nr:hypothetical protein [Patescibacteria group bacterium]